MNILDLLKEDHAKLRREMVTVRQCLSLPGARDRIKHFIADYEVHESIEEDILFPKLNAVLEDERERDSLFSYEQMHTKIWGYLEELVDNLSSECYPMVQDTFFKFCALTEAHFGYEERMLFPNIRQLLDPVTLEKLGKKAEKRCVRFSVN